MAQDILFSTSRINHSFGWKKQWNKKQISFCNTQISLSYNIVGSCTALFINQCVDMVTNRRLINAAKASLILLPAIRLSTFISHLPSLLYIKYINFYIYLFTISLYSLILISVYLHQPCILYFLHLFQSQKFYSHLGVDYFFS